MKFIVENCAADIMPEKRTADWFSVFVIFGGGKDELVFQEETKWLADFRSREDAEAFKSRKEKEYR